MLYKVVMFMFFVVVCLTAILFSSLKENLYALL